MSKFFDETIKARSTAVPGDTVKLAGVQELLQPPIASAAPTSDLGEARLEQCRKVRISAANLLHTQFKGSESLEPAEESYRALRTRLLRLRAVQGLRSIVVTSAIQGEGKTLTALNLALCCAQLHEMRILLVDGDIRSRGLTQALGLPSTPGLADVLSGQSSPIKAILATELPNLYVVSSGSPSMPPAELFASRRWQDFIGWCNESFKLILVDAPPVLNLADVELMTAACDGVLMVVRARFAQRAVLRKSASQIDPKKLLGLVYNATENNSSRYSYQSYETNAKER